MYRKSPKWPWIIRSKVTPYGLSSLLSPKFPTIHSTASRVRVTGHFQTSAPNHHKRTLNTKWSKVPNIEITTTPRAPNFTYFISTASRFQVTVHIETNALNDPKMAWNTKGQRYSIYITPTPDSKFSLSFTPWTTLFELHTILRQVHHMNPKWPKH